MRTSTEDLLKILDGEPMDAELKAKLLADASACAELERLRSLRDRLRALPELTPERDVWPAVRMAVETVGRRRRFGKRSVALAIAAGVGMIAIGLRLTSVGPSSSPPAVSGPPAVAAEPGLREQSARLERVLSALPRQPRVMSAATAGTIAGLEDRVASIDHRLSLAAAGRMELEYREALWRERVDVMTALVQVRYAQAQDLGD